MPRHLNTDAVEWICEIPTAPIYCLATPQPGGRAWALASGNVLSMTPPHRFYRSIKGSNSGYTEPK